MTFVRRAYRCALRAFPRQLRARFEDEALDAFAAGCETRRRSAGRAAAFRYAIRAIGDALVHGMRARLAQLPESCGRGTVAFHTDLSHAGRRLVRAPGWSVSVVALIALGAGAASAVFGALDAFLEPRPPFRHADRVVLVRTIVAEPSTARVRDQLWSAAKLTELRAASADLFDGVSAYAKRFGVISDPGRAESVGYEMVSAGFFELLGVQPAAGRFFAAVEEGLAAPPDVAVLSHRLWLDRFGGDLAAIGRTIRFQGRAVSVVGVAPRGFHGLTGDVSLWLPLGQSRATLGTWAMTDRHLHWFHVIARLREGATPADLVAPALGIVTAIEMSDSRLRGDQHLRLALDRLIDLAAPVTLRRSLQVAASAAFVVLIVVIVNVATLFAVRARADQRTLSTQLALGASPWRAARVRVAEALILCGAGAVVGVWISATLLGALREIWPEHLLRSPAGDLQMTSAAALGARGGVWLAALLAAAVAAVASAAAPVAFAARLDVVRALQATGGRGHTRRRGERRWWLAVQVACAVALLIASGLLAQSLHRLDAQQRGFDDGNLLVLRYSLVGRPAGQSPPATRAFHDALRGRLAAISGVRSVSLASTPPMGGGFIASELEQVDGAAPLPERTRPPLHAHVVDNGYFQTIGARIASGRDFTRSEANSSSHVIILTETAARMYFGDRAAVGRRLRFRLNGADPATWWTVVGISEDVLFGPPAGGMRPEIFVPLGVWAPPGLTALVRTTDAPVSVVPAARDALRALDPEVPFSRETTARDMRVRGVAGTWLLVVPIAGFAIVAVTMTSIGLAVTVARAVHERRAEIGVRMALGATPSSAARLLMSGALVPAAVGLLGGLLTTLFTAGRLTPVLFHTDARDPGVYIASALLVSALTLAATWWPTRRIARQPTRSLLGAN